MATYRVHKTKDYTVMSNSHFREKGMSLKAKGLLSLMLSLPDDWDYSIAGLVTLSKDGKDSVMNALTEIETFGYLKRTKLINSKGQFDGYDYDIYESPITEIPQEEKPYAENPNTEKPQQYITNQSFTHQSNTDDKKDKKERKTSFDEILAAYTSDTETLDLLGEWLKVRKAKRAAMTDRAIKMNIDKLDELSSKSGMSVNEYLTEVIRRGWAAFFEIKQYGQAKQNAPTGSGNIFLDIAKEEGIY